MGRVARNVRISGRVQGVFFRAWTRDQAGELGVSGWVRNCGDGSVEAHVEAEETAVNALIERMREGPSHAHVTGVQVTEAAAENFDRFQVQH